MVRWLLVLAIVAGVVSFVVDPWRDAGQYALLFALASAGAVSLARRPRVAAAIAGVLLLVVVYAPLLALVVWPLLLFSVGVALWHLAARVFAPSPDLYVTRRE